jgi:CheY-like chemotaxis protein
MMLPLATLRKIVLGNIFEGHPPFTVLWDCSHKASIDLLNGALMTLYPWLILSLNYPNRYATVSKADDQLALTCIYQQIKDLTRIKGMRICSSQVALMNFTIENIPVSELTDKGVLPDASPLRPVVLVVDDEPIIADTIVAILNNKGFAASAAYDGETALEMALLIPPALLITDVAMPGMSGIELAIVVTKAIPDCRILLFSGQEVTHDLLRDAKADGYEFVLLPKPVHPKDLLAEISSAGVNAPAESSGRGTPAR